MLRPAIPERDPELVAPGAVKTLPLRGVMPLRLLVNPGLEKPWRPIPLERPPLLVNELRPGLKALPREIDGPLERPPALNERPALPLKERPPLLPSERPPLNERPPPLKDRPPPPLKERPPPLKDRPEPPRLPPPPPPRPRPCPQAESANPTTAAITAKRPIQIKPLRRMSILPTANALSARQHHNIPGL